MPAHPVFVTGNPHKLAEARRVTGLRIDSIELDLPEIQSLEVGPILNAKVEAAWSHVGRPVIVEETSLELEALNGFPGPLVKWMLEAVGPDGIARAAIQLGNPRAKVVCLLAYDDDGRRLVAWGECQGTLVQPSRGGQGFGWDPVFVPDGQTRTCGEMSADEKTEIGPRGKAWRHFLELYSQLD